MMILNGWKIILYIFKLWKFFREHKNTFVIQASQGSQIASVSDYKYLGIFIDSKLPFGSHIKYPSRKLKMKLGFYFRN